MSYVRTTYTNEKELLQAIFGLYNDGKTVDLDPCYSKGRFYDGFEKPKLKFDISPQTEDTLQASCNSLPLPNESVNSIMFDPPFVIGSGKSTSGIMRGRFSAFKNVEELIRLYGSSLREFFRILKKDGIVIFKCQDTVTSGKQLLSHVMIINTAVGIGYLVEDLFVLVKNGRIVDPRWKQRHAWKTHSYYLVLRKKG